MGIEVMIYPDKTVFADAPLGVDPRYLNDSDTWRWPINRTTPADSLPRLLTVQEYLQSNDSFSLPSIIELSYLFRGLTEEQRKWVQADVNGYKIFMSREGWDCESAPGLISPGDLLDSCGNLKGLSREEVLKKMGYDPEEPFCPRPEGILSWVGRGENFRYFPIAYPFCKKHEENFREEESDKKGPDDHFGSVNYSAYVPQAGGILVFGKFPDPANQGYPERAKTIRVESVYELTKLCVWPVLSRKCSSPGSVASSLVSFFIDKNA